MMDDEFVRYLLAALSLLLAGYLVFRQVVRRTYRRHGRLTWPASLSQLLVFAGVFGFPTLFNPPEWSYFWRLAGPPGVVLRTLGLLIILLGFVVAFGTMIWFGLGRAFGVRIQGVIRQGPYRYSRNPQIIGGYFLVIGAALQWGSWYALGWIFLYGLICHWMVLTEEEHLLNIFGEEYAQFCQAVPRYLFQ